jgi:hypothetical protein
MYRVHAAEGGAQQASDAMQAGADAATAAADGNAAAPLDTRPTIAILPFSNLGGDPEQGYFSDGVTEDLIHRTQPLALAVGAFALGVLPPPRRGAGHAPGRARARRALPRRGQRAPHGPARAHHRPADRRRQRQSPVGEKVRSPADDLFAVQDEVVRTIVSTLVGRVQATDAERARRKPPASLAAYEVRAARQRAALGIRRRAPRGSCACSRRRPSSIPTTDSHRRCSRDPLQHWYEDMSGTTRLLDEPSCMRAARWRSDENESTCFSMLAWVLLLRRQYDLALQHEERAIALNPNNQWNCGDMGGVQMYLGDPEAALGWFARAREIDPFFDTPWYWRYIGQSHMLQGRFGEALQALDRVSVPTFPRVGAVSGLPRRARRHGARAGLRARTACGSIQIFRGGIHAQGTVPTQRARRGPACLFLAAGLPA